MPISRLRGEDRASMHTLGQYATRLHLQSLPRGVQSDIASQQRVLRPQATTKVIGCAREIPQRDKAYPPYSIHRPGREWAGIHAPNGAGFNAIAGGTLHPFRTPSLPSGNAVPGRKPVCAEWRQRDTSPQTDRNVKGFKRVQAGCTYVGCAQPLA